MSLCAKANFWDKQRRSTTSGKSGPSRLRYAINLEGCGVTLSSNKTDPLESPKSTARFVRRKGPRRRPGWKKFSVYMARVTIPPSSTSENSYMSKNASGGECGSGHTEVHLGLDDPALPPISELDRPIHRSETDNEEVFSRRRVIEDSPDEETQRVESQRTQHGLHFRADRTFRNRLSPRFAANRTVIVMANQELRRKSRVCDDDA